MGVVVWDVAKYRVVVGRLVGGFLRRYSDGR